MAYITTDSRKELGYIQGNLHTQYWPNVNYWDPRIFVHGAHTGTVRATRRESLRGTRAGLPRREPIALIGRNLGTGHAVLLETREFYLGLRLGHAILSSAIMLSGSLKYILFGKPTNILC